MSLYYSSKITAKGVDIDLKGAWNVSFLSVIEEDIKNISFTDFKKIDIHCNGLEELDSSAAWYLNDWVKQLSAKKVIVKLQGLSENHFLVYNRIAQLAPYEPPHVSKKKHVVTSYIAAIGKQTLETINDCYTGISFLGEFFAGIPLGFLGIKKFRLRSIVFHINEVGIKAAPIIALLAFAVAFVTGYQGAFQLQKFDATIYTVDLIALSTLREMGVLITAIMLAGRSGSSFAAQIGTMKLNEEIDALKTMGVSHFDIVVMPRIIAITISMPLLTVIADFMGLLGGYVFSYSYLGYSYVQFLSRVQEAVDLQQFYIGLYKAPVFAILIGLAGCMQGLRATMSAEDVGRKTILAVVQSIFLVVVADAIFSVIFTKLGI